ncbi:hypothetical protein ACFYXS_35275 [Streptomyces sp. NPDC002574]|uniref:hypothetical protein n=1 Tax=Streptomyces sp. NPDC002574 TaxID=3364652 RepID=UPI0036C97325
MNVPATPPRPFDVLSVFPELAGHARTAVRLHPEPAQPGPQHSSIGGPLAWPADEPRPSCPGGRHRMPRPPRRLGTDRGERSTTALVHHDGIRWEEVAADAARPMHPVMQVYARDVPWYDAFPQGTDVLQILWCPFQHRYDGASVPYNGIAGPFVQVTYRSSSSLSGNLSAPPEPLGVGEPGFLLSPCLLRPEPVTEYPHPGALGEEFEERVEEWELVAFSDVIDDPEDHEPRFRWELTTAPGWKLGGHEPWNYQGYSGPVRCHACGSDMRFVAAVAGTEWDGGTESWAPPGSLDGPINERMRRQSPTGVRLGDSETLRIFTCPASPEHPVISDLM